MEEVAKASQGLIRLEDPELMEDTVNIRLHELYDRGLFSEPSDKMDCEGVEKANEYYIEDFAGEDRELLERYVDVYGLDESSSLLDAIQWNFSPHRRRRVAAAKLALEDYELRDEDSLFEDYE